MTNKHPHRCHNNCNNLTKKGSCLVATRKLSHVAKPHQFDNGEGLYITQSERDLIAIIGCAAYTNSVSATSFDALFVISAAELCEIKMLIEDGGNYSERFLEMVQSCLSHPHTLSIPTPTPCEDITFTKHEIQQILLRLDAPFSQEAIIEMVEITRKHDAIIAARGRKELMDDLWKFCIINGAEDHGDVIGLPKDPFFPLKLIKKLAEMRYESPLGEQ